MKERFKPVGILAGVLFVVNIVARLIVRIAAGSDEGKQTKIGLVALVAVGLVVLAAAAWWSRRFLLPRVVGDVGLAVLVACVLSVLVGPFISSGKPFGGGAGYVFAQFFSYLAVCALGGLLGVVGVMVAGADRKSQAWKQYAETIQARPNRATRSRR